MDQWPIFLLTQLTDERIAVANTHISGTVLTKVDGAQSYAL